MITKLLKSHIYGINVYEGVSPALLATMSLANNIKGNNQGQLAASLLKARLILSNEEQQAWKYVDRKYFTKAQNPYANKPHIISKGENMTDVFTHSIIVSSLVPHLTPNPKILDIGTGHGYLSFLISKILQNRGQQSFSITGIDVNKEAINKCQEIHNEIFPSMKGLQFQNADLFQYLDKNQTSKFDAIIGGYFLDQKANDRLVKHLSSKGVGIWPRLSQSGHGQALYKIKSDNTKSYIIETLFSMPVVRSSVDKYFIQAGQQIQVAQQAKQVEYHNTQEILQYAKKQRKLEEQRLKGQLKILLEKYRKKNGKLLTLSQMKANEEINSKMQELQKLSKTKIKPKN